MDFMDEGDNLLDQLLEARGQADKARFHTENAQATYKAEEAKVFLAARRAKKSIDDAKRTALITERVASAGEQYRLATTLQHKQERIVQDLTDRHRWVEKKINALQSLSANYRKVVGSH